MARAIHQLSKRSDAPLIKVNCAAIPNNLIESEFLAMKKEPLRVLHKKEWVALSWQIKALCF